MKIIQLITSINLGGAENVAFNLSEFCQKDTSERFEFTIVEIFQSKNQYAQNKRKGLISKNIRIKTLFRGSKRISLLFAPFKLFFLLLKEKPQLVHSHTDLPDFVLGVVLKMYSFFSFKKPQIVRSIHNTELWSTHRSIGKFTESAFNDDFIVGVSDAALKAYQEIRESCKLSQSKNQQVIFNGCDIPKEEPIKLVIDSTKINIAFCGRFEYQKGIDILMERIVEINNKHEKQIVFHLIGSGTYGEKLLDLSSQFSNIKIHGPIDKIANKLHVFDYLIMPSRFEGLGLMSLEASLAKLPIIAAIAPGLSETLPENWPLCFELNDSSSLLTIIDKLVNEEYNLDELKEQAFEFVSNKFSFENMIYKYSELYASIK